MNNDDESRNSPPNISESLQAQDKQKPLSNEQDHHFSIVLHTHCRENVSRTLMIAQGNLQYKGE